MTKAEYTFMADVACLLDEMTCDRRFAEISRLRMALSKSFQALSEQYAEQEKQDAARHWSYPPSAPQATAALRLAASVKIATAETVTHDNRLVLLRFQTEDGSAEFISALAAAERIEAASRDVRG